MAAPVCYCSRPPILNPHSTAELPPNSILTTELAGDVSTTLLNAGTNPVLRTPLPAECGESLPIHAGPFSEFKQQPQAAQVSTDLVFETWATELTNDPDLEFILDGVKNGFQLLSPDLMVSHAFTQNNKSALRPGAKDQIEAQLIKGLREDHFAIAVKTNMPIIINALGAVPKKDSNELRMIMDCSRPLTMNANSYMDLEHYKYVTVDDAANLCQPGCWLAKVDLKHAYRSVGTHPDSWRVTGMSWRFNDSKHPIYLYDKRLPFGARASPMVFHRLTQGICRMMARRGYTVLAYLDDFLIIEPTQLQCKVAFDTLLNLLESLGFTINWSKVVYPTQCLIFLGVEIDTVQCELRLSDDRVSELLSLLKETSYKSKCTKLHLQRLLGKLNWAARVVRGGRTFLRRLITLANSVKRPHHRVYLNLNARADLMWWTRLLPAHNCKTLFPSAIPELPTAVLTDASLSGGGCLWAPDWMYVNWALDYPSLCSLHINYKETFTIVLAAHRWAPFWSGHQVVVKTDSQVAAAILNKGSTCCPVIMDWIRSLFWLKEYYNFSLFVKHIPGATNTLADSISRLNDVHYWPTFQAWLSKSSRSNDFESHMSPLSLALLRSKGSAAT